MTNDQHLVQMIRGCAVLDVEIDIWEDMSDTDVIYAAIVHDSSGYTPGACLAIRDEQHTALESAYALLKYHHEEELTPEEAQERWETQETEGYDPITEGFDGKVFTIDRVDLLDLLNNDDLDIDWPNVELDWSTLADDMYYAFIEAALWSTSLYDEEGNDLGPMDDLYDEYNLTAEARIEYKADCASFVEENYRILLNMYRVNGDWNMPQVGHDFALTRDGHGAGFWDGDPIYLGYGDDLTESAKAYGSVEIDQAIDYKQYPADRFDGED